MRLLIPCSLSLALLGGCMRQVIPPPSRDVTLAGHTAPVRDWSAVAVCDVNAQAREDELVAAAALLNAWRKELPLEPETWTPEQQKLLVEGQRELPALLEGLETLGAAQEACPGDLALMQARAAAIQASKEVRVHLDEARQMGAILEEAAAIAAWQKAQAAVEEEAHTSWCPTDGVPKTPEVYYAREDAAGKQEWFFCDGTRVVRHSGENPQVVPPQETERSRRPADRLYLAAIGRFPDEEVQRAPVRRSADEGGGDAP